MNSSSPTPPIGREQYAFLIALSMWPMGQALNHGLSLPAGNRNWSHKCLKREVNHPEAVFNLSVDIGWRSDRRLHSGEEPLPTSSE
jgi:hypothetical protein